MATKNNATMMMAINFRKTGMSVAYFDKGDRKTFRELNAEQRTAVLSALPNILSELKSENKRINRSKQACLENPLNSKERQ